jgi:predicted  nucleic acid-binding Zn-ribbon protein
MTPRTLYPEAYERQRHEFGLKNDQDGYFPHFQPHSDYTKKFIAWYLEACQLYGNMDSNPEYLAKIAGCSFSYLVARASIVSWRPCGFFSNFKRKWKLFSLKNHPDKGGDEKKFKRGLQIKEFMEDLVFSTHKTYLRYPNSKKHWFHKYFLQYAEKSQHQYISECILSDYTSLVHSGKDDLDHAEDVVNAKMAETKKARADLDDLQRRFQEVESEHKRVEEQTLVTHEDVDRVQAELKQANYRLRERQAELEQAQTQLRERTEAFSAAKSSIQETTRQLQERTAAFVALKHKSQELSTQLQQRTEAFVALKHTNQELSTQLQQRTEALVALEQKTTEISKQLEAKTEAFDEVQEQATSLQVQLEETEADSNEMENQCKSMVRKLRVMERLGNKQAGRIAQLGSAVKKVRGEKRKADAEIKEQKRKDVKMTKAFQKGIAAVDEKKRLKDAGHENKLVNKMAVELRKHCMVADKYKLKNNPEWCCVQDLINKAARSRTTRAEITRELLGTKKTIKGADIEELVTTSLGCAWDKKLYCRYEHFWHILALITLRATNQVAKDELFRMIGLSSNIDLSLSALVTAAKRVNKQIKSQ